MKARYAWFLAIVLLALAFDQATKLWADRWLASPASHDGLFPPHPVEFVVPPEAANRPLREVLLTHFSLLGEEQLQRLLSEDLRVDGAAGPHDPAQPLAAGQKLLLLEREQEVIPGHWNHRFVRNPAAAFGLFGGINPSVRRPIFIGVSLLSILLILYIFHKARPDQRLLGVALACILSGALGNFIDRIRLGYVIDFIEWFLVIDPDWPRPLLWLLKKLPHVGQEVHWPTFNIADAAITIGVGLLLIEVVRGHRDPSPTPEAGAQQLKEERRAR